MFVRSLLVDIATGDVYCNTFKEVTFLTAEQAKAHHEHCDETHILLDNVITLSDENRGFCLGKYKNERWTSNKERITYVLKRFCEIGVSSVKRELAGGPSKVSTDITYSDGYACIHCQHNENNSITTLPTQTYLLDPK